MAIFFNKYFTEIGPKLAKMKNKTPENFEMNCFKRQAFFSPKKNKSPVYDDISFNVVKNCFVCLLKSLLQIFNLSLQRGISPDDLNIVSVSSILGY